jgi:hypothetical protein
MVTILSAPLVALTLFFFPPQNSIFFLQKTCSYWCIFFFLYGLIFPFWFHFFPICDKKPGKTFYTFFFCCLGVGGLRVAGATTIKWKEAEGHWATLLAPSGKEEG